MRLARLLALLVAFAPAPTAAQVVEPLSSLEAKLLEDVADRRLNEFSLLEAALIVSGANESEDLRTARAHVRTALAPLIRALEKVPDPHARGRGLLRGLHEGTAESKPLLRKYEAEATTLLDVVVNGRFNCVSATILFLVAAQELDLDARAVLLPSHARAAVVIHGRRVIVETTNRLGFDASPKVAQEILSRFRQDAPSGNVDLYADERGSEVDEVALLGVIYTNLATSARERGELEIAGGLDARAERMVADEARPLLRRIRASTLGELAIRRFAEGRTHDAVELAFQAARVAGNGEGARLAQHNLMALGERRLAELSKEGDERELLLFPERFRDLPAVHAKLQSWAWTQVGAMRHERGDSAGAAKAAQKAIEASGGVTDDPALAHNLAATEINRVGELARSDPEAAWRDWRKIKVPKGDDELEAARRKQGAFISAQRAQRLVALRRCGELDLPVIDWLTLDPSAPADAVRASCRAKEGRARFDERDFPGAADSFREAMRLNPEEPTHKRNLVAALHNLVNELLRARRCGDAMRAIEEGRALDPSEPFFADALTRCAR